MSAKARCGNCFYLRVSISKWPCNECSRSGRGRIDHFKIIQPNDVVGLVVVAKETAIINFCDKLINDKLIKSDQLEELRTRVINFVIEVDGLNRSGLAISSDLKEKKRRVNDKAGGMYG